MSDDLNYYYHCTCGACPEQYDVYESEEACMCEEKPIAYIRLRWGYLYCEVPFRGETVYEHVFEDDYQGCMDTTEREYHIKEIDNAIFNYLSNPKFIYL